jgi:glycogen debranching enzyme
MVERLRRVASRSLIEQISFISYAHQPVHTQITLSLACDLASMHDIKSGTPLSAGPPPETAGEQVRWHKGSSQVVATLSPAPTTVEVGDRPDQVMLSWHVDLPAGQRWAAEVMVCAEDGPTPVVARAGAPAFRAPRVHAQDMRLARLVEVGVADAQSLQLADPDVPADQFIGAGTPWYLTLFGRDSLWAARMLLPLGTDLAEGTLRTLARRQGNQYDSSTDEEPGRIPHEIRANPESDAPSASRMLPPVYYGTVDATALWISLLHDAWRWGMPAEQVAKLVPNAEAALTWLTEDALDKNGFVAYVNNTPHGLTNQGWKDSANAIQYRNGRIATGPVALCEAQAYAVEAAREGADLLDAFGRPGTDKWRDFANALTRRFRDRFWIQPRNDQPPYPAVALDGDGHKVDTATSNLGHLLGTGLLDVTETADVVRRLGALDLDSGLGLRTFERGAAGYSPLSYHCGSVWPHDTMIAVAGLSRVGTPEALQVAASLMHGLVTAAEKFGYQLPELYGVDNDQLIPYPAACHPQAWAATSAVTLLTAALGLHPDAPSRTLTARPMRPAPFGPLSIGGLQFAGHSLTAVAAESGDITISGLPSTVQLFTHHPIDS